MSCALQRCQIDNWYIEMLRCMQTQPSQLFSEHETDSIAERRETGRCNNFETVHSCIRRHLQAFGLGQVRPQCK